jgi:hypothetical protein
MARPTPAFFRKCSDSEDVEDAAPSTVAFLILKPAARAGKIVSPLVSCQILMLVKSIVTSVTYGHQFKEKFIEDVVVG